ncbi:YHS domain-containing protein [Moorellaceae bacterium AZ2]
MEFLTAYLPYLILGGLMFFMMRYGGGCCGGHRHSQHNPGKRMEHGEAGDGHPRADHPMREQKSRMSTGQARDPVCGMMVNKEEAVYRIYDGQEYYFCREDCARIFEARRERRANL